MRKHGMLAALVASAALLAGCGGDGGNGEANGNGDGNGNGDLGRQVFTSLAQPTCASCHTLADAGSTGTVGPNLDDLQPGRDQVETAVRNGSGVMPSFGDQLSDDEIDAVAEYVSQTAGS